jgi:hypothetical protein
MDIDHQYKEIFQLSLNLIKNDINKCHNCKMIGFIDRPHYDIFYDLFNIDFPTLNLCIKCNINYICYSCTKGIKSYLCIDCQPYPHNQYNYLKRHWPYNRWKNKVNDLEYEINPFRSNIINVIYDQKNRWWFECPICYEKQIDSTFLFQLDCRHAVCGICANHLLKKGKDENGNYYFLCPLCREPYFSMGSHCKNLRELHLEQIHKELETYHINKKISELKSKGIQPKQELLDKIEFNLTSIDVIQRILRKIHH